MANVDVAPQTVKAAGITPAFTGLNASDTFLIPNSGRLLLYIKAGGGASVILTVDTPLKVGGLGVTQRTLNVGAGQEKVAGPFPPALYGHVLSVTASDPTATFAAVTL